MKKINSLNLAFIFAGCFLGAGFISGQELWQFFGSFGKAGIFGIVIACFLLCIFGIILTRYVHLTGISDMDKVVIKPERPILRGLFVTLEIFFLFGIYVIMTAGVGALLNQIFGLPSILGSLVFCILVTLTAIMGIRGIVTAFSVTVPLLVVISIVIFIYKMLTDGQASIDFSISTNTNPLLSNWLISSVVFVSYNLFASIGILTPIGKEVTHKRTTYIGIATGSIFLLIIALSILLSLSTSSSAINSELPMLELSLQISKALSYIFAILLFGGMFGTSVSSVFAIDEYIKSKLLLNKKTLIFIICGISLLSFLSSIIGFGKLISVVYPICGYLGVIALILIIINFIKVKHDN